MFNFQKSYEDLSSGEDSLIFLSKITETTAFSIRKELEGMGVSFFEASARFISGTLIECSFDEARKLIKTGAVGFFDLRKINNCDLGNLFTGYRIYVSILDGNGWIAFEEDGSDAFTTDDEDLNDDDSWVIQEPEYDQAQLKKDALELAILNGFGPLRNRDQRAELALKVVKGREIDDQYKHHVAALAETFFDFGVLNIAAKKMIDSGKSMKDVASHFGVTKNRVERALKSQPSDFVIENYKH